MDALPHPARIVVIGNSAAGKSTLARELSAVLGLPRIELDELFWAPGWQPKPAPVVRELVLQATAGPAWVADGNYGSVRPVLWPRANVIVWLNYSLPRVFWRGLRRTVRRWWHREELWHGNRESFRRSFLSRESILVWILSTHRRRVRDFRRLQSDPQYAGVRWLEFSTPKQADAWLRALQRSRTQA